MSMPYGFGLAFHVGYQTVDAVDIADLDIDGDAGDSYLDWRVGISEEVLGRAGRQLLGCRERGRSFADSGRRLAGHGGGEDTPEILRILPRYGCRFTPDRRDPSAG